MNCEVMFSSKNTVMETPKEFFDLLNREFNFTLDVCALPKNAKCKRYFTPDDNGLLQSWGERCFCSPPYGREISQWVCKASDESKSGTTVVMLLPVRTDTRWFYEYIYQNPGVEVRFVKGRLRFGNEHNSAPFPSMVVIFHGAVQGLKES